MIIRTVQEANRVMEGCCECLLPLAPDPSMECQSMEVTTRHSDTDYTDAVWAWERARDEWAYGARRAWVYDRSLWLLEDPEREPDDYPVTEPPNKNPFDFPDPPPVKPPGYDRFSLGDGESTAKARDGYVTYVRPEGEDLDETPEIYQVAHNLPGTLTLSEDHPTTRPFYDLVVIDGVTKLFTSSFSCTPTVSTETQVYTHAATEAVEDDPATEDFDETAGATPFYSATEVNSSTIVDPVTKQDLIARARAKMPTEWPYVPQGESCSAKIEITWPLISDHYIGGDPEAVPPVPPGWPPCADRFFLYGVANRAEPGTVKLKKIRYRLGIPEEWKDYGGKHAKWVADHATWESDLAAWESEDSEERGPRPEEPVEPIFHPYYELQWDIGYFSKAWDAWKALKDAYDAAVRQKEEWDACEELTPGECGEEPEVPDDPGEPPAPAPEKLGSESWLFEGAAEKSGWFEIEIPVPGEDDPEILQGECRVVNLMIKFYRCARTGTVPTSYGEIHEFAEEEPE